MSAVDDLCRSYLDLRWHFDPAAASAAGVTSYDDRLGRFDEEAMRQHLAAFRAIAAGVEDAEVDALADEVERTALLNDIRATIERLEHERPHERDPQFWLAHLFEGFYAVLVRDGAPGGRAPAVLERLRAVPAFLDAARATLRLPPAIFVDAALAMLGGGGELLVQVAAAFGAAVPERRDELNAATTAALQSLAGFGAALGDEIASDPKPHAFAVGEAYFNRRLYLAHGLGSSAAELWRYGLQLEEQVTAELDALARTLDGGASWRELVERLRADLPAGDLLAAYRSEVERARQFVADRDLVSLPDGPLDVVRTPPFLTSSIPFAAYDPPPLELPDLRGRFFVTVPDAARSELLREHCAHDIPWTAVHEGYPGHHLQLGTAHGLEAQVRRHVWSPVTVEGWALYCEGLMDEQGFSRGPEERLFRLVNLLWRAIRIHLDVALHTRETTPAEAVQLLTGRLPIDVRSAEAEVRRYCTMPTYQLCYAVGRRELLALRDAYRARAGDAFSLRRFHDDVLAYGGLPVSLIRWGMELDG